MKQILILLAVVIVLFSCKDKKDEVDPNKITNKYVNEWVYGIMSEIYYWNSTLTKTKDINEDPNQFFKSLKNKDDRFSAIFESYEDILNQLNGVSSSEIGFDFQLFRESNSNNNVYAQIRYVKRGTPAEKLGLKRGVYFRKINGQQITMTNYSELINKLFDNSANTTISTTVYQNSTITDSAPIVIAKVTNYQENPVYLDTVYTVNNKKVGYFVYNFFTNDPGDNTMKYDLQLNNTISKFKMQNVTELIVDLRYNGGGMMSSAINFASMLVPDLTTNMVFSFTEYNQNFKDYFNSQEYKSKNTGDPFKNNFSSTIDATYPTASKSPIQNIGNNLQRIYFLTGRGTASASEMVINGLKPFIPCVLIGDTTVGKNVGSTLVNDEENKKNQWAFMPIILKYFNKNLQSDFTDGFAPNYLVEDNCYDQLGDTKEVLLNKAISLIGGYQQVKAKAPALKRTALKSSVDFKATRYKLIVDTEPVNKYKVRL